MRKLAISICTFTFLLAGQAARAQEPTDFPAMGKQLLADARKYLEMEPTEHNWKRELRGVEVTEETLAQYKRGLLQPWPPAPAPYVVTHYLRPLAHSEPEIINQMLPLVEQVFHRYTRWTPLPQLSRSAQRSVGVPDHDPRRSDAEAMQDVMRRMEKRTEALKAYEKVRRHNNYVAELMEIYTRITIRSGNPRAARTVINLIRDLEQDDLSIWARLVRIIGDEAKRLEGNQAKAYYKLFVDVGQRVREKTRNYPDPTELKVPKSGQAQFGTDWVWAGRLFLATAQKLADHHDLPDVDVPKRKPHKPRY